MVLLLIAVFFVALLLGDYLEAGAVGAVLAINISIGFATELRARRAMEALSKLQVHTALVVREGAHLRINAREVVPGDVIVLTGGEAVPADARVLDAVELEVNEAPLTGESFPVSKHQRALAPLSRKDPIPLADRSSMVYKGTMVSSGDGLAYVVGTGAETEIGRVSDLIHSVEEGPTPLERKLAVLGRRLIWATLAIAGVITGIGVARGREPWLMVETGLALAIAAVPEGLPVVATIALAVGLQRMARRRALVRRLSAVEGLGGATVVCADKTGTLTTGQMTVTRVAVGDQDVFVLGAGVELDGVFQVDGRDQAAEEIPGLLEVLESGVFANRASIDASDECVSAAGDPTEVALLVAGSKAGLSRPELVSRFPETGSVPFSSERMMMATFHGTEDGGTQAYVKGAPGRIIDRSSQQLTEAGVVQLDKDGKDELRELNRKLSGEGLRVLAVARRPLSTLSEVLEDALNELTFLGLVGIADPPANRVRETLSKLDAAGIATIMITGDQANTAEAVARSIGLPAEGAVVSAPQFDEDEEAPPFDASVRVFARVSPGDKLRIVKSLQKRGEVVAMIGDGINDAPAIKQADIGVAMGGRGTDVAKETADLVLQDDRFETIGAAVEEGRVIFENIRKFVFYLFSCNLSEVGVLSLAAFTT
ncbi:MAG: cation-translocating P-type ATPase, partial [Longimicrobiales bacterium]